MKPDEITPLPLAEEHIPAVIGICDRYLGEGLYSPAELRRIMADPHAYFSVIPGENEPAGIFYCHAGTVEEICGRYHYIDPSDCRQGRRAGVLRSVAIREEYRSTGLAEALIDRFTGLLFREERAAEVFVMAWLRGGYVPASHCLGHCGFTELRRVEHPWYDEVRLKCGVCGQSPCVCDGVLYYKRNEEAE